jgi:starvation-inducible DNA-binding protein
MFNTLHLMFETPYELWLALGPSPNASARSVIPRRRPLPGSQNSVDRRRRAAVDQEVIRPLVMRTKAVVRTAQVFPAVDAANDEPTADLLTQRMQIHEKNAWMLRSLLEG